MDTNNTYPRNSRCTVSRGGERSSWVEKERISFIQLMNEAFNTELDTNLGRSRWCYLYWSDLEGIK